jgi:argininosuccinate lyase
MQIVKMMMKNRKEREAEIKAKIAKMDAYVEEMNAKGNLTDEEKKEVISAMQQINRYLRGIGAPESDMYDI